MRQVLACNSHLLATQKGNGTLQRGFSAKLSQRNHFISSDSVPPYVRRISLKDYTSPLDPVLENGGNRRGGKHALMCSKEILLYPLLHGSSMMEIDRNNRGVEQGSAGPGTDADCAELVRAVKPDTVYVQQSNTQLQMLGQRVWLSRAYRSQSHCSSEERQLSQRYPEYNYKDVWSRWNVYTRIHGGPLFVELQKTLAATMSLTVSDNSNEAVHPDVVPIDREPVIPVRRFHEKCLYSNGDKEFKGYMKYATQSINFWYNRRPLSQLPALKAEFKRLCPLAYSCLVDERARFMAAQILKNSDGGPPIRASEAGNKDTAMYDSRERASSLEDMNDRDNRLSNIGIVACGAMEIEALEHYTTQLLRRREEAIETRRKKLPSARPISINGCVFSPVTSDTSKTDCRPNRIFPIAAMEPAVATNASDMLHEVDAICQREYIDDITISPPVTQVPLLIFRYFVFPVIILWVIVTLLSRSVKSTFAAAKLGHQKQPDVPLMES